MCRYTFIYCSLRHFSEIQRLFQERFAKQKFGAQLESPHATMFDLSI
jgi:hypothetical protein